ncbi:SPX domain-containing protein 4 [Platanthera guangdongensis]|uniref:SPX domain-containing protein 4 n=1 Tax=Platanthera guangdongensis TaxID=2320717 RepID=A0ABR2LX07_9ASPA
MFALMESVKGSKNTSGREVRISTRLGVGEGGARFSFSRSCLTDLAFLFFLGREPSPVGFSAAGLLSRFLPAATTRSSDSALQRFSGSRKTADAPLSSDYRAGAISSCGREKTMKFGKDFRTHLGETLPEWRDKFLCYKPLKKLIKNLLVDDDEAADDHPWIGFEEWFVRMLDEDLEKFNDFSR